MKTIWKYDVKPGVTTISMPEGACILTVQVQSGSPKIWALVDTEWPPADRRIEVFGTGHEMPFGHRGYIGTFQLGKLVFHVFENMGGTL